MPACLIKRVRLEGHAAVELTTDALRVVAVYSRGPRLAHLSRVDGTNLLLWAPGQYRRNTWDLMGGHRCWLARPGADESEETYFPDNRPCAVEFGESHFVVSTAPDPCSRIVRGLRVECVGSERLRVVHFARNESDMLWSGALWGLTCTVPNKKTDYIVPLADGSTWDTATMTFFKRWGGTHTGSYDDPQFKMTADSVLVRAQGRENKRAFRTAAGVIALHDRSRDVLFAKCARHEPGRPSPIDSNVAVYTGPDAFMVEMETMGPFATLRPGETLQHVEEWFLGPAPARRPDAEKLRALFAAPATAST